MLPKTLNLHEVLPNHFTHNHINLHANVLTLFRAVTYPNLAALINYPIYQSTIVNFAKQKKQVVDAMQINNWMQRVEYK